ncbi:helix-turn-helix domain-containing protein [Paenibacillus sp. FSL L8-0696]|uniref:helix-turn-helix domain-containing protein n=1 Tax=Paenibacillus sp. FSL L8-0696 TaxID=2954524 RepID=UPI003119A3D1
MKLSNNNPVHRIYLLKEAGKRQCGGGHINKPQIAQSPLFLTPIEAIVQITIEGETVALKNGEILFLSAGATYQIDAPLETVISVLAISYEVYGLSNSTEQELVYGLCREIFPVNGILPIRTTNKITRLFSELEDVAANNLEVQADRIQSLLHQLHQLLVEADAEADITDSSYFRMLAYIHQNFQKEITREMMSRMMGFNPRYFSVWFRKQTGWSFTEYVTHLRVNKAKKHLMSSKATIQEISQKVGYTDGLYLSRKFKQVTGMTPTEFRLRPKPKRIVALQFLGDLLALGVKPVAVEEDVMNYSLLLLPELAGVRSFELQGCPAEADWSGLEADLVIAPTYLSPRQLKCMEKLGPLVTVECDKMDRLEQIRLFGRLLGEEERAEAWIRHYHLKIDLAKQRLSSLIESGETVAVYEIRQDNSIYIWNYTARGVYNLYPMLGVTPPDKVRSDVLERNDHLCISLSELPIYAADHMFVVVSGQEDWMSRTRKRISKSAVWRNLPAFRNECIYYLKLEEFWGSEGLALERQLEIQTDLLTGHKLS